MITGSDDLYVPYEQSDKPGESFDWETGDSLQDRVSRSPLQGYGLSSSMLRIPVWQPIVSCHMLFQTACKGEVLINGVTEIWSRRQ